MPAFFIRISVARWWLAYLVSHFVWNKEDHGHCKFKPTVCLRNRCNKIWHKVNKQIEINIQTFKCKFRVSVVVTFIAIKPPFVRETILKRSDIKSTNKIKLIFNHSNLNFQWECSSYMRSDEKLEKKVVI